MAMFLTLGMASVDFSDLAEVLFPDIGGLRDFARNVLDWLPTLDRPRLTLAMGIGPTVAGVSEKAPRTLPTRALPTRAHTAYEHTLPTRTHGLRAHTAYARTLPARTHAGARTHRRPHAHRLQVDLRGQWDEAGTAMGGWNNDAFPPNVPMSNYPDYKGMWDGDALYFDTSLKFRESSPVGIVLCAIGELFATTENPGCDLSNPKLDAQLKLPLVNSKPDLETGEFKITVNPDGATFDNDIIRSMGKTDLSVTGLKPGSGQKYWAQVCISCSQSPSAPTGGVAVCCA